MASKRGIEEDSPVIGTLTMPLLFESVFFGAYSALFLFSTVILCRRSPSRTRNTMLALTVVMFAVSATHWALIATLSLSNSGGDNITFAILYLPAINYILSDGIVLWRAWVLWNHKLLLFIIPLISLVCTLGATIASAAYYYIGSLGVKPGRFINSEDMLISLHLEWAIWFLTVGTNLWATGLIFIRAWQHRRFMRSLRIKEKSRGNTEKALLFLVESGTIYLCIWIAYITTSLNNLDEYGMGFIHIVIAQVVGMYPTTIIIVVAMRLSTTEVLSRPGAEVDTQIVFAPPSANPQPQATDVVQTSFGGESIAMSSDNTLP